jgi:hypothetical protein
MIDFSCPVREVPYMIPRLSPPLAALRFLRIFPIFVVVAPCERRR